jgi:hypothetical protein
MSKRSRSRSSGTVIENTAARGANTGQGTLVAIALRLKVVGGLITEVEQLAIRPDTDWVGDAVAAHAAAVRPVAAAAGGARAAAPVLPLVPGRCPRRWWRCCCGWRCAWCGGCRAGCRRSGWSRRARCWCGRSGCGAVGTGDRVEAMGAPHPIFAEVIPEAKRPSREQLIETANYYFTGLARNDGKGYYPFTDDCERFENGIATTQRKLQGAVREHAARRRVAYPRSPLSWPSIASAGSSLPLRSSITSRSTGRGSSGSYSRSRTARFGRVEAVFHRAPYGIPSGWSTFEQAMSEAIQSVR